MAQHRFVALMSLWFLVSTAWSFFDWWALGKTIGLVSAAATAGMTGLQIVGQAPVLACAKRWGLPSRLKFYAAAAAATLLFVLFQLAIAEGGLAPRFSLKEWLLLQGASLLAWYAMWWGAIQRGWVHASTSLTAAGVHGIFLGAFWDWPPMAAPHWLWAVPLRFFAGWSLMFLPSAVGALECTPQTRAEGVGARRIVACVVPAIAALIPALFLAWFMAAAHR